MEINRASICRIICPRLEYLVVMLLAIGFGAGYIVGTLTTPGTDTQPGTISTASGIESDSDDGGQTPESLAEAEQGCLYADISGAVLDPGVYCMQPKSTLIDLIKQADGFQSASYAATFVAQHVNLAQELQPNAKYYIPHESESICDEALQKPICVPEDELVNLSSVSTVDCGKGGGCVLASSAQGGSASSPQDRSADSAQGGSTSSSQGPPTESAQKSSIGSPQENPAEKSSSDPSQENAATACININTADAATLESISGIGPSTAQKIIEGRPYNSVSDLLNVSGIGQGTLDKIAPEVCAEVE